MTRRIALLLLSLLLPALAFAQTAPAALVEGVHYEALQSPGTWDKVGKGEIEVAEVFSYNCHHCADMAPKLDAWKATLPKNVRVRYVAAPYDGDLARAFFASESLNALPRTHLATFRALHDERTLPRNPTIAELAAFYGTLGVDASKLSSAMQGKQVDARMEAARAFTTRIELPGTPTMIVAGRWRVLGNSLDDLLANTAALVKNPPR
jgi:thiol:disulfide interchange protein DsbA